MKSAIFTQFQVVPGQGGCHFFGLDNAGRMWERFTSVTAPELTVGWSLMEMPQREKKLPPWEQMLALQEELRAAGRDVEVIEYGEGEDHPQSVRLGGGDGLMKTHDGLDD